MRRSFDRHGNPNWAVGMIIDCLGKKGSGKSVMGRHLFDAFPGDRLVISPNHDDGPFEDRERGIHTVHGTVDTLPVKWPEELRRTPHERITLRYVADPGSPSFTEDCDYMIGLAFRHERCCVLVHEVSDLAPSGRVPPHMRRALRQNRHAQLSMILCNPRPITIDPLCLAQADLIYVFDTPNPDDRKRIADSVGLKPAEIDTAIEALRPHEFLRIDTNHDPAEFAETELPGVLHSAPLSEDVVKAASS